MWVVFNYNPDVWNVVGIFDTQDEALYNMGDDTMIFVFNEDEEDKVKDFIWNISLVRKNISKYNPKLLDNLL